MRLLVLCVPIFHALGLEPAVSDRDNSSAKAGWGLAQIVVDLYRMTKWWIKSKTPSPGHFAAINNRLGRCH